MAANLQLVHTPGHIGCPACDRLRREILAGPPPPPRPAERLLILERKK